MGMLVVRRPDGGFTAEECDCRKVTKVTTLLKRARIPERYRQCSLENFDTNRAGGDPSLAYARMMAQKFVDGYPATTNGHGLLLIGKTGLGKTHLAAAILHPLVVEKGVRGLFWHYRELLREMQNAYSSEVQTTEMQVLRPVFDAEVLVLDELGASKPTTWILDAIELILNTRYNRRLTTIVTTNFPDEPETNADTDLRRTAKGGTTLGDRIGERMRSRLAEMCVTVQISGQDYRQNEGRARFG
jgi:DNA replication protein DnaC